MSFIDRLKDEIFATQKRRHEFLLRKLSFTIALLGVGALGKTLTSDVDLFPVLYLVPFIAIAFDMHIVSEEFRIKRIGEFVMLNKSDASTVEREWEQYVRRHPSFLPSLQNVIVTSIIIVGAAAAVWWYAPPAPVFLNILLFIIWVIAAAALEVYVAWGSHRLRHELISAEEMDSVESTAGTETEEQSRDH